MRHLLFLIALLIAAPCVRAQTSSADSLRHVADSLQRRADTLRNSWDVLWKQSDSLRIESMFLRMESNALANKASQLRKQANSVQEHNDALAVAPSAGAAVTVETQSNADELTSDQTNRLIIEQMQHLNRQKAKATAEKVRSGQTLSDSATAMVLRMEPDTGMASYYGKKFHGRKTASGETFNMNDKTCAHRWLPFGTQLKAVNLSNGKTVTVRVNDRGPFHHGRIIDVSFGAAQALGMVSAGTAKISIELVDEGATDNDEEEAPAIETDED